MSAHVRTQVRAALALHLDGIAAVAGRVHSARTARFDPQDLPCLVVGTPAEQLVRLGVAAPCIYQRSITVQIDGYVCAAPLESAADGLSADVERAVAAAGTLGGLVKAQLVLVEVQTDIDDAVSPPLAMFRMTYLATVITDSGVPDVAL